MEQQPFYAPFDPATYVRQTLADADIAVDSVTVADGAASFKGISSEKQSEAQALAAAALADVDQARQAHEDYFAMQALTVPLLVDFLVDQKVIARDAVLEFARALLPK